MDSQAAAILKSLNAGSYEPVYFLQGEEVYFIDLISEYIEANVLAEHEKSFNQTILYGKDTNIIGILNHARRFPMMAERQVVMVKEAQDITDLNKEQGAKQLLDYLKNPVPSTLLVFCHKHKALDKRRELGKSVDKLCVSATFKKLYDNQLPAFISSYVNEKGLKIEDQAVYMMAEYVGNDLSRLTNEIDKILIGKPNLSHITVNEVVQQVGISKEYNIFELQKALVTKNSMMAQKIALYFSANTKKNPMIPVVAFLYAFFSKLLVAAANGSKTDKEIVSVLKINPYAARDYAQALKTYSLSKIIENIALLKEADLKLKGVNSTDNSEGSFRELVFRLMF